MTKQSIASRWLFFSQRREGSSLLWVNFAGCALATLCVFGGFGAVQWAVEHAEEVRNIALQQTGVPFAVSNYSPTQVLGLQLAGVKYQLWIALALTARWFSLFAYRFWATSTGRKWLALGVAEVGLILAILTFAWYGSLSYRVLRIEAVCSGCTTQSPGLLGSTPLWTSLLAIVVLVQTIYGVVRLVVPAIDMVRAKDAIPEA